MARITEAEVHAAAAALDAQGIKPTSSKVREKLGSGSFSTIQTYLATYEGTNQEEPSETPEELESLLPIIWDKCFKIARDQFELEQAEKELRIVELENEVQTLKTIVEKQDEQLETYIHKQIDAEALEDDFLELKQESIKLKAERDTLKAELKEIIKAVGKPKETKKPTQNKAKPVKEESKKKVIPPNLKTADWTEEAVKGNSPQ